MSSFSALKLYFAVSLAVSAANAIASEPVEKPPREAPDPLGQFLEHEYIKDKLSVFMESQYYDWENKSDSSQRGSQLVMPVTVTYRHGNFDFGLRRAYIDSKNKSTDWNGQVSTWSDTALTLAYTFKELAWPVRLSLDYNLPNGKATLDGDERYAVMDSFLVQQTQFGEGENITPGIGITKAVGKKDVFGAGLSYSKKGSYDPNKNVTDDVINPGNEVIATLQWQHKEARWMVIGGLIATRYGSTERNGIDYYQKGNRYDINLTSVHALPWELTRGQQLMVSLRYVMQDGDRNFDPSANALKKEADDSNPDTLYLSLDWSKNWGKRHTAHLLIDYLKAETNDYVKTDANYQAGKSKLSLGIGYDYAFSNRSMVSVKLKQFTMTDKAEAAEISDTKYHGSSLFASFTHQF